MGHEPPVLLLVEENATLRATLRAFVGRRLPVALVEATSGAEAAELARRHQPEVVLFDLTLPDQIGKDFVAQLQTIQPTARLIAMVSPIDPLPGRSMMKIDGCVCLPKDSLAGQLEPAIWQALLDGHRSALAPGRLGTLLGRFVSVSGRRVARWAATARADLGEAIHWLDVHGPWAGRPRTRLLYLANLAGLLLVMLAKQHAVGA